ncbi:MAG: iron transporter [Oscillospiraceae bacterium]|nr:iron transporter [Oscillospiraceae bacterium]
MRQNGIRLRRIGVKALDGFMMPTAASGGPHYGNNIALAAERKRK